jgi:hypothetical protein
MTARSAGGRPAGVVVPPREARGRFFQCLDDYAAQVSKDWRNLPAQLPPLEAGIDTLHSRSGSRMMPLEPGSDIEEEPRPYFARSAAESEVCPT